MSVLQSDLRNQLGKAIVKARNTAEAGSRTALESLAVDRHEPFGSMSIEQRKLRNRLRARGRQLGDVRNIQQGTQTIHRLTHEIAYEHWHRMLFARFLAENNLLIHPHHNVPVSLQEIDELARETGEDPHAMAARFAQVLLPLIFRTDDPVLEVILAPEIRQTLEKILDSLPTSVFTADDSLGWTYQYWQAEKKDEVNESGNKIGADELPAVTQLFTEHYMVLFLYHNTIGAWHAGKVLAENPILTESAMNEEELRQAVRLHSKGGYSFDYLRFVREQQDGDEEDKPTGPWRPAAGTFDGWPKTTKELKILDPCCGSGHFLIEGLELLVRLRMDEEALGLKDAINNVLTDNLHGLEIDSRCTQIAAFNLALAAWKMIGKPIDLPPLHIACTGLAVGSTKAEWIQLAGDNTRLRAGMGRLYKLFEQAPELGSLIDPSALKGDLLVADFAELHPLLEQALERETDDAEDTERAVTAQGMARAAELLSSEYTLVITNVPFLTEIKYSVPIAEHVSKHFADGRSNLATVFIQRMLVLIIERGALAFVSPQSWWFLGRYEDLRKNLLQSISLHVLVRMGERAFQSPQAGGELVGLTVLTRENPIGSSKIVVLDVSEFKDTASKANSMSKCDTRIILQKAQIDNQSAVIIFSGSFTGELLSAYATALRGCGMGDSVRFIRNYWEIHSVGDDWEFHQTTSSTTRAYGGMSEVIYWQQERGALWELAESVKKLNHAAQNWRRGKPNWGKSGIVVSQMGGFPATIYEGDIYDPNCCAIVPNDSNVLPTLWVFCSSPEFHDTVRRVNQNRKVEVRTFLSIPFDFSRWQEIAILKYPNGLPDPYSDDPTQWLFHGHPSIAEPFSILQVAVGRLLGYRWPPEFDRDMHLADEAREWIARCDELKKYADNDGIVCLSATRGEHSAADRLRTLLSTAFGSDWSACKERELLSVAGNCKKPATSLEVWLLDKFFEEHCKLFHHRPFIWHIWDGNKSGFHCLINAHKLTGSDGEGRRTLEAITYSYLGDWIERQKANQQEGKEGADARLDAAQDLQGQLEKILEGEPPYDLFVRWKSLQKQAIGWEPDINDGVRLNIRPFMNAELRTGGKKGAGILRWQPNITWKKNRGKEPQSLRPKNGFPWFWSCPGDGLPSERTDFSGGMEFDGNRWNDLHYTRAVKEAARKATKEEI